MISTVFSSLIAFWLLILSIRVVALRGSKLASFLAFNNFGEKALSRSIRAQANLIEYAPIFLIMLFIAEFNGSHPHLLYFTSILFLIARVMHGIAFGFMKYNAIGRIGGTIITFMCILILGVNNLLEIL